MDGASNSHNNTGSPYSQLYDENVILNCVRNRKKVTELPSCPLCSCTIRQGELDSHLALEIERLQKLSNGSSKRKLSSTSSNLAVPSSSTSTNVDMNEADIDMSGCPGSDVYQRVNTNRLRRLRARRRSTPPPAQGECPVCNAVLPTARLQRHALRCLKRTGAEMDEDVPDTSSEEGSIDVENDEPSNSFGASYEWCGEWRVRAAALGPRPQPTVRRADQDMALKRAVPAIYKLRSRDSLKELFREVVDGDEDAELYGPAQYSPSRIAADAEINNPTEDNQEENRTEDTNGVEDHNAVVKTENKPEQNKHNGLVEASAETRIQALKARIKEMEKKQNTALEAKCLICLGPYISAAVSIQCWHVYCEVCWLQSLKAKKICPQCNVITTTQHLRRIYM